MKFSEHVLGAIRIGLYSTKRLLRYRTTWARFLPAYRSFWQKRDVEKPKGVFVIKLIHAHGALRTICILDKFFNNGPRYPIRIFADVQPANSTVERLKSINPLVDLQVIVNEEQWKQLPEELSPEERAELEVSCNVSICTTLKATIGYVYMGYWRYRRMAYEESLRDFDYYITIDDDSYLTKPWDFDPFQLLHDNNLTAFYPTDFATFGISQGVAETSREVFGDPKQGNGYLNTPETFPFFDNKGSYNRRALYGFFFGGRLDFFRSHDYEEYCRRMVPYTYRYRVDEQPIITMAWSMLAADHVWHLPTRGYNLGVYHHSFVDDELLINCAANPPEGSTIINNTDTGLCYWRNPMLPGLKPFDFQYDRQNFWSEPFWVDYNALVRSLLSSRDDDRHLTNHSQSSMLASWEECYCLPTKDGSFYANQCSNP